MQSTGERPGGVAKQREGARTQQEAPSLLPISSQHGGRVQGEGALVRRGVSTTPSGLASFQHTADQMKVVVVKIHSAHAVKRLFL